jgi:hypothetical protein
VTGTSAFNRSAYPKHLVFIKVSIVECDLRQDGHLVVEPSPSQVSQNIAQTAGKNVNRSGLVSPFNYARHVPGDSRTGLILVSHVLNLSSKLVTLDAIWSLFSQYISGLLQLGGISTVKIALLP